MMELLVGIFTSGAGGGIFGTLSGLFKGWMESREKVKFAELTLQRDRLEYEAQEKMRVHELTMAQQGAESRLTQTRVESEAAAEVANMGALSKATVAEFANLHTSSWMDNIRASVRPLLAYYYTVVFSIFLGWVFYEFHSLITADQGSTLLMTLFDTLTFIVCSIITFFYVSRNNNGSKRV